MPTQNPVTAHVTAPVTAHVSATVTDNTTATVAEQLFIEQALAYYRDMKAVADNAPDGHVIHLAETFAVIQGRELVRKTLALVVQEQVADHEKKTKRDSVPNAKAQHDIADDKAKNS